MNPLIIPSDEEIYGKEYYSRFLPDISEDISLDYVESDNLDELEAGIRSTVKGFEAAVLTVGLALAKIAAKGLFIEAGFNSFTDYLENSDSRLAMPKQTAGDYIRIAGAWIKYHDKLLTNRFQLEGNISKLRVLDRAVELHGEEPFKEIANLSYRNFVAKYIRGIDRRTGEDNINFAVVKDEIVMDGAPIAKFHDGIDPSTRKELTGYLRKVFEVKARGESPVVFGAYDENEARAIDRLIKRYRQNK